MSEWISGEWISVEDGLPDEIIVRVTDCISECYGWVHDDDGWILDNGHNWTPTHWQELSPLPEPPK